MDRKELIKAITDRDLSVLAKQVGEDIPRGMYISSGDGYTGPNGSKVTREQLDKIRANPLARIMVVI